MKCFKMKNDKIDDRDRKSHAVTRLIDPVSVKAIVIFEEATNLANTLTGTSMDPPISRLALFTAILYIPKSASGIRPGTLHEIVLSVQHTPNRP